MDTSKYTFRYKLAKKLILFCFVFFGIFFTPISNQIIPIWFDSYRICNTADAKGKTNSFSNIASLKTGNLSVGQIAKTSYFSTKGDLGGATYSIDASPKYNHENLSIPLDNGLFANLIISNRSVNVASIGIFPNQDMVPLFEVLEQCLVGYVDEFKFNNGTYTFTKPLRLGSFSFTGSSSTTLMVSPAFSEKTYRLIRADSKDWGNTPLNLNIKNISFLYETHSDCPVNGTETLLLAVAGCANCNIDNCNFTARPSQINGCFAMVDLLWFRDGGTGNIQITNSKFYNQTATAHTASHLKGGCFWYMGNANETSNSISAKNCWFYNTTSDESVAIWGGTFKNIVFEKCEFNSNVHQCDGMIGMNAATFENITFNKCKFQSDVATKKQLFFYKVKSNQSTNINVSSCSFINNNSDKSTIVPGDGDINAFISVPFNEASSWSFNVNDCSFQSLKQDYVIKSIVNMYSSPNVNCNFAASNRIEINTTTDQISRSYVMGNYY